MTPGQRKIIFNSLGLLYAQRPYRNRHCAPGPYADVPEELIVLGYMERGEIINSGTSRMYYVTEAGANAIGHQLPKD